MRRELVNAPGRRTYESPLDTESRQVIASQRNDAIGQWATWGHLFDHFVGACDQGGSMQLCRYYLMAGSIMGCAKIQRLNIV